MEGAPPEIGEQSEITLGRIAQEVEISLRDADSGLRAISVRIVYPGESKILLEREFPGSRVVGGSTEAETVAIQLDTGELGLPEGAAELVVTAHDWSWRNGFDGNVAERRLPLRVDTTPPRLAVESGLTYIDRGGSGAAVYQLGEAAARDGVEVGDRFFRGHPIGGSGRRVAIFAIPVDAPESPAIRVVAEDAAGNRSSASFPVRIKEVEFESSAVSLSQRFLEQTVRPLAEANGFDTSDLSRAFRDVNETLRASNEARIREVLAAASAGRRWSGAFEQMRDSKVTSRFAEKRRYQVAGRDISGATHYGFDLASTAGAAVPAANAGVVVFAEDLGIYGKCVLIDHGLGVSSLYGHLSGLAVAAGEEVSKGQELGRTGATGLAGGDHLHFAMLVGDAYVNPLEWWDPEWVRSHVEVRLQAADR
jgi:murein DD-endopeptidase MepM/ murein hydrolase activator NlpD